MGSRRGGFHGKRSSTPSEAERQAQSWHKEHHRTEGGRCWCCCSACREVNPHHHDARTARVEDIFARIRESLGTARMPDSFSRRQL
jgi:hypothetical protein